MGSRSEDRDSQTAVDVFAAPGDHIAGVLRAAAEEAAKIRDEALAEAAAIRATATDDAQRVRAAADADADAVTTASRVRADELERETQDDRDKAKALLVRARERADRMVSEAEQQVAVLTSEAEAHARDRVTAVLENGRLRLERLAADEHLARTRLIDAQNELQGVIRRITDGGPFIDLTTDEPSVRLDGSRGPYPAVSEAALAPAGVTATNHLTPVVPRSAEQSREPRGVGRGWADPAHALAAGDEPGDPTPPQRPADRTVDADPLNAMVRDAVDRAVAHSSDARPRLRPSNRRRPPPA